MTRFAWFWIGFTLAAWAAAGCAAWQRVREYGEARAVR